MYCKKPVAIKLPNGKLVKHPITGVKFNGLLVPCGKCVLCKIAKTREWALRCCLELQYWNDSIFTTLTYDEEHLPPNGSLVKKHLQDFIKRLRSDCHRELKYFACGEYGEKGRCHFHIIIFGLGISSDYNYQLGCYYSEGHFIENNWSCGHVFNGSVTSDSVRYCAGYIFKKYGSKVNKTVYEDVGLVAPFQLQSNGIGRRWFADYNNLLWNRGYILYNGNRYAIPRYFIDKMKNQDLERYQKLVELNFFLSFDDEVFRECKRLSNVVGYDLKPEDVNLREIYIELSCREAKQNYLQGCLEEHRMEIKEK